MDCLVVLGGKAPSTDLLRTQVECTDLHIAVDAGYHPFHRAHLSPDLVLGDMDSIDPGLLRPGQKMIELPDQEFTDLEKTLQYLANNHRLHRLVLLGADGGRLDHFLATLQVAASFDDKVSLEIITANEHFYRVTPHVVFDHRVDLKSIVSISLFSDCKGIIAHGFKWSIDNVSKNMPGIVSQSNLTTDPRPSVRVKQGVLYVIVNQSVG